MRYALVKTLSKTSVAVGTSLLGLASSAWAQVPDTCSVSLSYVPTITSGSAASAVPSLTFFGTAILGTLIAGLAWRHRKKGTMSRIIGVIGLGAAASLLAIASSPMVNTVRAAGPYELSNPAGGTLTDDSVLSSEAAVPLVVTNTSGVPLRITALNNAAQAGTCSVGSQLAPAASCTVFALCPPGGGTGGGI